MNFRAENIEICHFLSVNFKYILGTPIDKISDEQETICEMEDKLSGDNGDGQPNRGETTMF